MVPYIVSENEYCAYVSVAAPEQDLKPEEPELNCTPPPGPEVGAGAVAVITINGSGPLLFHQRLEEILKKKVIVASIHIRMYPQVKQNKVISRVTYLIKLSVKKKSSCGQSFLCRS
jgi:hypothetical protein